MSRWWLDEPEDDNYPDALEFLTLIVDPDRAQRTIESLRRSDTVAYKCRDILRASGVDPLTVHDAQVREHIRKVRAGQPLSPVLLIRGDSDVVRPLVIADGFHRVCAVHILDEDSDARCRIVSLAD
jgi:hypothetical protein